MAIQPSALANRERSRPPRGKRISILLADQTRMACQLLKKALTHPSSQLKVAGCATNRGEILLCLRAHPIDVAVVSESLEEGPLGGIEVLSELRTSFPETRVIFLLKSSSEQRLVDAFRAGAKGVFCESEPIQALRKSIQAVSQGQIWANSRQLQLILEALSSTRPPRVQKTSMGSLLTRREEEVANLVAEGLTNRGIAEKLGLREHTVSNYLFRIYDKLGVSSRVELVLYLVNQHQQSRAAPEPFPIQG